MDIERKPACFSVRSMPQHYVTFSRNVFIPLTNICRNKCGYCGYRRDIGHPEAKLLSPDEVLDILSRGAHAGCSEALFTFGERPHEVPGFKIMLREFGYDTIIDYLVEMCRLSIHIGLLPHSNPGTLLRHELEQLKPYNASMGLMLETLGDVESHYGCEGKLPAARLKTIELAGELGIPFTTGILVGIGESWEDRVLSIRAIGELHKKFEHIQEVIIQNFVPKPGTNMASCPSPGIKEMIDTVVMARQILSLDVAIQVSPNLINPKELIKCGASDLGGISNETIDYINPECAWPGFLELKAMTDAPLRERLPLYPQFVRKKWYSEAITPLILKFSDSEGFRKIY